jgi:hypothetical protein
MPWCVRVLLSCVITGRHSFFKGRKTNTSELQTRAQYFFSLKEIESATRHFDPANKIGEGGFGPVYKVKTVNFIPSLLVSWKNIMYFITLRTFTSTAWIFHSRFTLEFDYLWSNGISVFHLITNFKCIRMSSFCVLLSTTTHCEVLVLFPDHCYCQ